MRSKSPTDPIGIFDSGVGGLSVYQAIRELLPAEHLIYIADQAHVPYGQRTLANVRQLSEGITRALLSKNVKLIVVACNTASAAALHNLREKFPGIPFVGMEPAVKPAAKNTNSGIVGVLATPATFQGHLYASLVDRFATDLTILQHTCPGLVEQIEAGSLNSEATINILKKALTPMIEKGADTIVLGCTHYPFVIPAISTIVGSRVKVIDPAPAIARQTQRVLENADLLNKMGNEVNKPSHLDLLEMYTTGNLESFRSVVKYLLNIDPLVHKMGWEANELFEQN